MLRLDIDENDPNKTVSQQARQYLYNTDWYIIRFTETAVAVPTEILDDRELARQLADEE